MRRPEPFDRSRAQRDPPADGRKETSRHPVWVLVELALLTIIIVLAAVSSCSCSDAPRETQSPEDVRNSV